MPFLALQDHGTPGLAGVIIVALVLGPLIAAWGVRERWLPTAGRCISEPAKWLGLLIAHIVHPPFLYRLGGSATSGEWLQVPCPIHGRRDCTPCSINCQISGGLIAAGMLAGIGAVVSDRKGPGAMAFYAWMGSAIVITFVRGLVERATEARRAKALRAAQPPRTPAAPVVEEPVPAARPQPEPIVQPRGEAMHCPCDAQWAWGSRDGQQCTSTYSALRCTRPDGHAGPHHSHDQRGACSSIWAPELTLEDRLDAIWEGGAAVLQAVGSWVVKTAGYTLFPPLLFTGWHPADKGKPAGALRCAAHDRRWCKSCILSWFAGFIGVFVVLGLFADRAERVGAFGEWQWPFLAWFAATLIGSPYVILRERLRGKAWKAGLIMGCPVDARPEAFERDRWAKQCGQPAIGGIGLVCTRQHYHEGPHHSHDLQGACIRWGDDEDGFAWPLRFIGHILFPPSIFHPLHEDGGCINHRMPACSRCLSVRYTGFLAAAAIVALSWIFVLQAGRQAWSSENGSGMSAAGPFLLIWSFIMLLGFGWSIVRWNDRRIQLRECALNRRPQAERGEPQAVEFIEPEAVLPPRPEPAADGCPEDAMWGIGKPDEERCEASRPGYLRRCTRKKGHEGPHHEHSASNWCAGSWISAEPQAAEPTEAELQALEPGVTADDGPPLPPEPVPEQPKPYAPLLERIQTTPPEEATQEKLAALASQVTAFEQEHGQAIPELREALTALEQMAGAARQ